MSVFDVFLRAEADWKVRRDGLAVTFFISRNASLVGGGDAITVSAMAEGKHISLLPGNSAEHS